MILEDKDITIEALQEAYPNATVSELEDIFTKMNIFSKHIETNLDVSLFFKDVEQIPVKVSDPIALEEIRNNAEIKSKTHGYITCNSIMCNNKLLIRKKSHITKIHDFICKECKKIYGI